MSNNIFDDLDKFFLNSEETTPYKVKIRGKENLNENIKKTIEKENKSLSKYINNLNPELKNIISNIENNLMLSNFPSFNFIYQKIDETSLNLFIENINEILLKTRQNREKTSEYLNQVNKSLNENNELKKKLERLKNDVEQYKTKILNMKQDSFNEKGKLENINYKLKSEISNLKNEITKYKTKETTISNQMKNDRNQYEEIRQSLVQKIEQLEKKLKDSDSIQSIPLQEYYLKYDLSGNNYSDKTVSLTEEMENNLKKTYIQYYEDNEYLKKNICQIIENMISLTKERKNFFLNIYKDLYEKDFTNEKNVDLEINYIVEPNLKSEFLINELNNVFNKFTLFMNIIDNIMTKKFGMNIQEKYFNIKNEDKSLFNDKSFEKFYSNQMKVLNYYQNYCSYSTSIINILTRWIENKINVQEIKDIKMKNKKYLEYLKSDLKQCIQENKNVKELENIIQENNLDDNSDIEMNGTQNNLNENKDSESIQNDIDYYFETLNNTNNLIDSYLKQIEKNA